HRPMDIWVAMSAENADKVVQVLEEFGFRVPALKPELFLKEDRIIRMGEPPLRIEIRTTIDGVTFAECYARRTRVRLDGLTVNLISLADLRTNKAASGRPKDLDDLEHLQTPKK